MRCTEEVRDGEGAGKEWSTSGRDVNGSPSAIPDESRMSWRPRRVSDATRSILSNADCTLTLTVCQCKEQSTSSWAGPLSTETDVCGNQLSVQHMSDPLTPKKRAESHR